MEQKLLIECEGGTVVVPKTVLNCRRNGGHLVVNPPRPVWERSVLTAPELANWSYLVAAAGEAMLLALPLLADGCLNYWEAGNWALNDLADPAGPKIPREHRKVHLHIFGRSRTARHPDWEWGESPRFRKFADLKTWSAGFEQLNQEECGEISRLVTAILLEKYDMKITA